MTWLLVTATVVLAGSGGTSTDKLFQAVKKGDVAAVQVLLDRGADPNASINGWRPLMSLGGSDEQALAVAKLLVASGAKVNVVQQDRGWTPLTWAAAKGEHGTALVSYFLEKGADVGASLDTGETALHLAARANAPESVRELLRFRANLRTRTHEDHRPDADPKAVGMASVTKRYQSLGKGLVSQYEPGYREAGKTPLFAAARSGSVEIANMLFHSGADLRARDLNDWTVVHEAAQAGKADVLQFFIQKGASPNAASKAGFRPLHVAMRGPSGLPAIECIQVLLKSGASPNMRNETGQTPLDLLTSDYRRALSSRSAENPNLSPAYKAGVAQAEHLLKVAMKRPTAKPAPAKVSPKAPKKPAKKARAPRKHIGP